MQITTSITRERNSVGTIVTASATEVVSGLCCGVGLYVGWTMRVGDEQVVLISDGGNGVKLREGTGRFSEMSRGLKQPWAQLEGRSYVPTPHTPAWLTPEILRLMEELRDAAKARISG